LIIALIKDLPPIKTVIDNPITLTNKILTGIVLKINSNLVSLYLRNAPSVEPIPSKINFRPFIDYKIIIRGH
jgi:hypothetical protein